MEGTQPQLVIVSNRLPVARSGGAWKASAGGLVTALRPVVAQRDSTWVGWDGGSADLPPTLPGTPAKLVGVHLSAGDVRRYYDGFSNRTLWPLFHDQVQAPVFDRDWWRAYQSVNARIADIAAGAVEPGAEALWWLHDYHLLLAPTLLRDRGVAGTIGFFLHIPWPPPELYARLPWRADLLRGVLGADLVSFHTEAYRRNFVRTCRQVLGDEVRVSGSQVALGGRSVRTLANPISIDVGDFTAAATSPEVAKERRRLDRQFGDKVLLLGVDRLDYTKGIPERLEAIDLLLERRADLRSRLSIVQLAVPSRGAVEEYQELRDTVERITGHINGRFTEPGSDVPVYYLHRGVPLPRLVAYYCRADVMMVTPLKDGMNLVAKEFVTCQGAVSRAGALVLSEFTGAATELREALPCNPFDPEGLSHVLEAAVELDLNDRRRRMRAMSRRVARADVHRWARVELERAGS